MKDRELRRLSRTDLLELLLAQRRENEQLRCILDQTQAQLADRTIRIDQAGSIAEASLQLSGIFEAAQDSCQYYVDNIRQLSERQNEICQQMEKETSEKCAQKEQETREKCAQKEQETREKCAQMERETKENCDRMVAEAEMKTQLCWENCSEKIKQLVDSFEGLQQAMDVYAAGTRKSVVPNEPSRPNGPSGQIIGTMY